MSTSLSCKDIWIRKKWQRLDFFVERLIFNKWINSNPSSLNAELRLLSRGLLNAWRTKIGGIGVVYTSYCVFIRTKTKIVNKDRNRCLIPIWAVIIHHQPTSTLVLDTLICLNYVLGSIQGLNSTRNARWIQNKQQHGEDI